MIISTDELNKYFGKEVTPAKMKEQIMALLDEWKEKAAARTGKAGEKERVGQVTGPRFWTFCPEVNAPRLGWARW